MWLARLALLSSGLLLLTACSFHFDWLDRYRAEKAIGRQDYFSAVAIFKKIMDRDPDARAALLAARRGATLAHLETKNYPQAVDFYKEIVLHSPSAEERKDAERFIAQIHFENMHDYAQAVTEYEKLLMLDRRSGEDFHYRLNLAKSHFYLNNIDQALNEIDIILSESKAPEELFEAEVLKANTEVATKHLPEAAVTWQTILTKFPEKAAKENVALNLAVCYEDMKDFGRAIEVLEKMRQGYAHPEFLDLRIQRLKERMGNMPGAHGGLKR